MDTPEYDTIVVYHQTKQHYNEFPEVESSVFRRSESITDVEFSELQHKYPLSVNAPIINDDCVNVATEYVNRGFNPIILNMSDWMWAGGGVEYGCRAQEEELFRRSNYFKHLHQKYYPLRNLDTIISHGVEFFRHGLSKGYVLMDNPVKIDCIAAPALRHPELNSEGDFESDDDYNFMKQKIRMLLYAAAKNGNDSIILSAWGCGAFRCPPIAVARLFKESLEEFAGVFKETPFAILGKNYQPFADVFNST